MYGKCDCGHKFTEKDVKLGVCTVCGAMLPPEQTRPKIKGETVEKSRPLGENRKEK